MQDQAQENTSPREDRCFSSSPAGGRRVSFDSTSFCCFDAGWLPDALDGQRAFDLGAVALGYNAGVIDPLELIHQVAIDIPQRGERTTVSVTVGFIATVP